MTITPPSGPPALAGGGRKIMHEERENPYDREFYLGLSAASSQSAREVVPRVVDLLGCRSVVDVGCGTGEWLKEFSDAGVEDILGIDSSGAAPELLSIPRDKYLPHDLRRRIALDKVFDLAMSLEVAEHLPPESADTFVSSLIGLSPVVLFSASIPHQDGTNHINEQWPEYWVQKFETHGFVARDIFRGEFWFNERVAWWYRQNLLLFVNRSALHRFPRLEAASRPDVGRPMPIVHPELFLYHVNKAAELSDLSTRRSVRYALLLSKLYHRMAGRLGR